MAILLLLLPLMFLPSLVMFLYKTWWKPISFQRTFRSQGLKGPPYSFMHGNTHEIVKMKKEAIATPMDLSQHDLFARILPHVCSWIKSYGNNFVIWMGTQPEIVVTEPELVKEILTNKNGVYRKIQPTVYVKRLLGDGVLVAEGEKWSRHRKLANRSFHGECLKEMFQEMVASLETMLEKWRYLIGIEIEVNKEFKILTSEVISRTAFGSSYQEGKNIFEMLAKLTEVATGNVYTVQLFGSIFRSKDDVENDKIEQSLRESILTLIRKREAKVKSGEKDNFGSDFLGSLLEVHHDKDPRNRISIDDIIDECKVFYVAGHETNSNLLSWSIFLLSVYKDWQEKAREEVLQHLGQENPTTESIAKLRILSMIINEALRLYGPAVSLRRQTHHKTRLGRYEIPANVQLSVPLLAMHSDPDLWGQDAHVFDPERFSEGLAKANKGSSTAVFFPFGLGPRMCLGVNFATYEAKIALSMILQHYKFALSPNYVHSPAQITTINPQYGIQIILQNL